jgi:hypothetical protein
MVVHNGSMSLMLGYWPTGYVPRIPSCGPMMVENGPITLPRRYAGAGAVNYCDASVMQCDEFGRAALETLRDSYHTMPTGNVREFVKVFSAANFAHLAAEVKRRSGHEIDGAELFDAMIQAFTMIAPRTDVMDVHRRLNFSDDVTASYVDEVNVQVLDRAVEETIQANRLWDFYAKNRNGPSELPDNCDVDTRTRLVGSFYAADYWMPD